MALNFTAFDIETASATWDTICAISLYRKTLNLVVFTMERTKIYNTFACYNTQNNTAFMRCLS